MSIPPRCGATGKAVFESKAAAKEWLRKNPQAPARVIYRCVYCLQLHLTKAARHGRRGGTW